MALRGLSHPESSRKGNFYGMVGMAIAIMYNPAVWLHRVLVAGLLILLALAIGGGVGGVYRPAHSDDSHAAAGCRLSTR